MRSPLITLGRVLLLGLALAALLAALAPARGLADVDPAGCTDEVAFDPAIPTYESVVGRPLGDGGTGSSGRDLTADIYKYFRAVKAATENNPRVRLLEKSYGKSVLGQDLAFWVLSTPENIANLDAGRRDAAFWAGVRDGSVSESAGLAAVRSRPAPAWITSTPHGAEPAGARRSAATCTSSRPARTAGTPCACATWTSSCCPCATRTVVTRSSARARGRSTTTATSGPRTRSRTAPSCRSSSSTRACSSSTPTRRATAISSRPTRIPSTTRSPTSQSTTSGR